MKIWSIAIKNGDGEVLSGVGSSFTIQGAEHSGKLYVEDEDNFYSVVEQPSSVELTSYYVEDEDNVGSYRKLGSQYNDVTNVYTRSDGVTCYETSSKTVYEGGSTSFSTIYVLSNGIYSSYSGDWRNCSKKTYYTRSNGAFRYTTTRVDTPLYTDGGKGSYTMYKKVTKDLYAKGTAKTFPAYKAYSGKLYDAGTAATLSPAEIETKSVTALTV